VSLCIFSIVPINPNGRRRLRKHTALAPTFAAWQDIVADLALDRKLASQVIVFELGMIISGDLPSFLSS
jgi:hypothetical protein